MSYRNSDSNFTRRPSEGNMGGFRVYVGDIGRIQRGELEKEFEQYGPVSDIWMGKKKEPAAKDYAFVVYRHPEDAEEAVRDRNGRKLCGRTVRVEHARPVGARRGGRGGGGGGWNNGGGGGGWGGGNSRNFDSQRGGDYRRRSLSRERVSYRSRSRSGSPVRSSRVQQSPPDYRQSPPRNRRVQESPPDYKRRSDNPPPKKVSRHSSSESPEPQPSKSKTYRKQVSVSPPPVASKRPVKRDQNSDSEDGSISPPPQKKKQPQRARSSSADSLPAKDSFDARQYKKTLKSRKDVSKSQPSKSKGKYSGQGNYSSDDY